ncbi:MAG TPA: hypothetical protein VH475_15475, partial [Tepidisphaeraceae bacterium]
MTHHGVVSIAIVRACLVVLLTTACLGAAPARGDDGSAAASSSAAADQGVVPIAALTGNFWSRPVLTGDWGGPRADLARKGVQFDLGFTQVVQSVVDGGRDTGTRYGGNLDLVVNIDLMRMGLMPGAFVKLRAESRYGQSVNGIAGPILPVNTVSDFPLGSELDETI